MEALERDRAAIRAAFLRTHIFQDWSAEALDKLTAASELRRYTKNERFMEQTKSPEGLWLILDGGTKSYRTGPNGRQVILDFLLPGQIFGLVPLFDGQPAMSDMIALEDTLAVFIPHATFLHLATGDPARLVAIVQILCRRARVDIENAAAKTVDTIRIYLAKLLLHMARGAALPRPREFVVPLEISQDDLANMMGVSRQTVNKEMSWLVSEKIIAWHYRKIHILDFPRLFALIDAQSPLSGPVRDAVLRQPEEFFSAAD